MAGRSNEENCGGHEIGTKSDKEKKKTKPKLKERRKRQRIKEGGPENDGKKQSQSQGRKLLQKGSELKGENPKKKNDEFGGHLDKQTGVVSQTDMRSAGQSWEHGEKKKAAFGMTGLHGAG